MYCDQMLSLLSFVGLALASCPYMDGNSLQRREGSTGQTSTQEFLSQFELDDSNSVLTSDVGGPIGDQFSLKAGERGPTLLEDFIFRQKIQHFDHERVGHACPPVDHSILTENSPVTGTRTSCPCSRSR
jgi:catalase